MAFSTVGKVAGINRTRSPAVAEGPRDAGVPVEILTAVERLYYTPNEYRSRVCVSLTAYVKADLIQYRLVTDRQTDRQTYDDS